MVSTAGDASLQTSTVLVKLKSEIISESNFPLENLIRYNVTGNKTIPEKVATTLTEDGQK